MVNRDWSKLPQCNLAAIESTTVDRLFLLQEIARYFPSATNIYFWNRGYCSLHLVELLDCARRTAKGNRSSNKIALVPTEYDVEPRTAIDFCVNGSGLESGLFIIEGMGKIDELLSFQLRNAYFALDEDSLWRRQIILTDEVIQIPLKLHPLIPQFRYELPTHEEISQLIEDCGQINADSTTINACIGLPRGEIKILLNNRSVESSKLTQEIMSYKTSKLAGRGLRIVPEPDVKNVGGLDNLERDLAKIKKLFTPEAIERGLRPPKGCCLWGLPGTGKSLISKLMSQRLNATLISCDWNELLDLDLAKSLAKLQYVLDLVDSIGPCILFFDEFEKAFSGWNSGANGGILAKMAGKLLTWMQDHTSPSIMLATINHLDMLPPELIRRFQYIWFFPSRMHNGAMWEVFKIHLDKHFRGLHELFSDSQWRKLFLEYRGCSPAEIAKAVECTHDELFFTDRHLGLNVDTLLAELLAERTRFKPAITNKTTSNALAKILMEADFARPVRGQDTSRFAETPRGLFESIPQEKINLDQYEAIFRKLVSLEPEQKYSFPL